MQRKLMIVSIMTIVISILLFPKPEEAFIYEGIENTPFMFEITIDGAVVFPGTYVFFEDVTTYELINRAGGLEIEADDQNIIYQKVYSYTTNISIPFKNMEDIDIHVLVNINQASFKELLEIPYMTETKAANLIIYREANGAFQSIEELVNVKYIGVATLENIRPYITI